MKFTIAQEALAELEDAARLLNGRTDGLGFDLVSELERGIDCTRESPEGYPKTSHDTRTFIIERFHYGIVYRVQSDRVRVIACAHLHRRPAYWKSRLRSLEDEE